jgi:hypothetical protein
VTDSPKVPIAEDLQTEHRIFSTGKNVRPLAEDYVKMIERTSSAEAALEALQQENGKLRDLVRSFMSSCANEMKYAAGFEQLYERAEALLNPPRIEEKPNG